MIRRNLDLILLALLTIFVMVNALAQWNLGPVTDVLGSAFVLFTPGYLIALMIFPEESLEFPVRVALSIGLSLALAAIGGILLYASGAGLANTSWIALIAGINIVGSLVVLIKRGRPDQAIVERYVIELGWTMGGLLLLIVAGLTGIILMARQSAYDRPSEGFTELWIANVDQSEDQIQIGIHNQEHQTASYDVVLRINGRYIEDWPEIELDSTQQWVTEYHLPPPISRKEIVVVSLYQTDKPNELYRRVQLQRDLVGQ